MKHLRKFDSVADLNAAIANSTIGMIGLAYNGSTPVMKKKDGGSPVPPTPSYTTTFYVENITQQSETLTIKGKVDDSVIEIPVEYSTDGTTWSSLGTTGATLLTRTINPGDKVYLRATANTWCGSGGYEPHAEIKGISKVGGNIMSLLYGSNFTGNETTFPTSAPYTFANLFSYNSNLLDASDLVLPATTLAEGCYYYMFKGCTSLVIAPALPATTLAQYCYGFMFGGCTSLTTAPALPATTLTQDCYDSMFDGCSSLTWEDVPELPATTLATSCYVSMFQNNSNMLFNSDYEYDEWCTNHIPASANYDKNTHGTLFDIGGIM